MRREKQARERARMELGPGEREEGRLVVAVCSAIGNALLAGSGGEKPGRKRQ